MARRLNVLVIDDNRDIRELVRALLESMEINAVTAASGREGLALCEAAPPFDLILSDVGMPDMSGIEIAQTLASRQPTLPVVLMTGRDSMIDTVERHGAVALMKPFTAEQLWRVIEERVKDAHLADWLKKP